MQLFAIDENGLPIASNHADKQCNYRCYECKGIVRLRSGIHRRKHFYHVNATPACRLNGKSLVHLQVQCFVQSVLPQDESALEVPFPDIQRIADIVWESKKIVFEIQCSPISRDEVLARNKDYRQAGYQVIWILHENRYNRKKVSSAELALSNSPYYYTNIDRDGNGMIYDQFDLILKGMRYCPLDPVPIHVGRPMTIRPEEIHRKDLPLRVKNRIKTWPLAFEGDLVHTSMNEPLSLEANHYFAKALEGEKKFYPKEYAGWTEKLKMLFFDYAIRPYGIVIQMLLEKASR